MKFLIAFALAFLAFSTKSDAALYQANKLLFKTITISNGTTTSAEANIGGYELVGFTLPATMTGTAVSFTVSPVTGGTFVPTYNSASALVTWTTTAGGRYYSVNSADSHGWQFIKMVSGTAEGADRLVVLHLKAL